MTVLLIFGLVALATAAVVVVPFLLAMAALWLVTLPFRLFFNLLFGGLKLLMGSRWLFSRCSHFQWFCSWPASD